MTLTSRNLSNLSTMILLTYILLCHCANMPYWQRTETSIRIDFGIVKQTAPENETTINEKYFSNSIDIGITHSCFKENYCIRNRLLQKVISLPSEETTSILICGVLTAGLAYIFSLLLLYYTCNWTFFLLIGLLWISFVLLFIGIIGVQRVLVFNNWASWGFVIGTIFIFISAFTMTDAWYKYDKIKNYNAIKDSVIMI